MSYLKRQDNDEKVPASQELIEQVKFLKEQAEMAKKYVEKVKKENDENEEKLVDEDKLVQLDLKLKK